MKQGHYKEKVWKAVWGQIEETGERYEFRLDMTARATGHCSLHCRLNASNCLVLCPDPLKNREFNW